MDNNTLTSKRSPGRPPAVAPAQAAANKLIDDLRPVLPPDLIEYLEESLQGAEDSDSVKDMEILVNRLRVYVYSAIGWAQQDAKVTKDIATLIAELRMSIRDLEAMRVKRQEMEHKHGNEDRMVDPTRKPALDRFESFHNVEDSNEG